MSGQNDILRVIAFPGAPNLPNFAAMEHGFFADQGLDIVFETTPSSVHQAQKLAAGAFDVAFTAFDNVVAYSEGQGAAKLESDPDFCVIMGATQLELAFVVAPGIKSYDDLRGCSIALDAVSTGFAFVLYAMLERAGLSPGEYSFAAVGATPERWQAVKAGEHAGTLTIEPFTSIARTAGFRVLEKSTDLFPTYQGGIVAARRGWVRQNGERVKGFIRAYLAGLDWILASEDREAAKQLLLRHMPQIKPAFADTVIEGVLSPRSGLTPDGTVLPEGMKAVLALRSRYGEPRKVLQDPAKYLELGWHQEVLAERR
jgi:ABC-type nitrate/sulfonate/bicarbonate transport system substrate-binding protein